MAKRTSHLTKLDQISVGERKLEKKKGRKKERRRRRREKLPILSRFPGNRTVGSGRSKRQSWSTHRELRMGIEIRGFRQTPIGRRFSPTRFNSYLRSIQMVEVFGAGSATHFSPKYLGLNAGLWDCFRIVQG